MRLGAQGDPLACVQKSKKNNKYLNLAREGKTS